MSGSLLVRGARQLVTLRGIEGPRRGYGLQDLGVIRDGAVLIVDGRVTEIGVSRRVENLAQAHRSEEIDATGRVVMPGFVDAHTHLVWDAPWAENAGDRAKSGAAGLRNISGRRLESRARNITHGMARHGTTTIGAESGYGLDHKAELKALRIHAKLNRAPLDVTSTFLAMSPAPSPGPDLLAGIQRRSLAQFVSVRQDVNSYSTDRWAAYLETIRSLGFQFKVHAGAGTASDAVRLAMQAGAVSVDQLENCAAAERELLAESNIMAVLLPPQAFRGEKPRGLARDLIDSGVPVALGSNFSPRANPAYNMQTVVAWACAQPGMTPEEAITAATFNAACAIGAERYCGSLQTGKLADLLVLNASDYHEIPQCLGVNLVHRTVKRGVMIYQEGKVALP